MSKRRSGTPGKPRSGGDRQARNDGKRIMPHSYETESERPNLHDLYESMRYGDLADDRSKGRSSRREKARVRSAREAAKAALSTAAKARGASSDDSSPAVPDITVTEKPPMLSFPELPPSAADFRSAIVAEPMSIPAEGDAESGVKNIGSEEANGAVFDGSRTELQDMAAVENGAGGREAEEAVSAPGTDDDVYAAGTVGQGADVSSDAPKQYAEYTSFSFDTGEPVEDEPRTVRGAEHPAETLTARDDAASDERLPAVAAERQTSDALSVLPAEQDTAIDSVRLSAEGIRKEYGGRVVVSDVNISVGRGEVIGLLGPNGAGKTTSFYMIVGLVRPDSGKVSIGGRDITPLPVWARAREGIGYLPQEASVFRELTVRENIDLVWQEIGRRAGRNPAMRGGLAGHDTDELLERFGITHIADTKGYALSGGERRRVEIARAMTLDPKFILLDEPFSGIDPIAVNDLRSMIRSLKAHGCGVLITDHNVRETLSITDRTYLIHDGRILMQGSPDEVAADEMARKFYLGENFQL